jgi:hypothetical protein
MLPFRQAKCVVNPSQKEKTAVPAVFLHNSVRKKEGKKKRK